MRRALGLTLALAVLGARPARADLPPEGARIRTHDYAIDLSQTVVLSGTRVTGLGGAFVAIGEGLDGSAQNPAAVAFRTPWSRSHFDYELGLGLMVSSALANSDLFNSGRRIHATASDERFVFLNLAGNIQLGNWGFGLSTDLQEYAMSRSPHPSGTIEPERLVAQFAVWQALAAHAFFDGELLVGIGQRWAALNVYEGAGGSEQALFSAFGSGFQAGILIRPNDAQYRIGAAIRSGVEAHASPSSRTRVLYPDDPEHQLFLPNRVALPFSLHVGFALQLGPRPLNPRWFDPNALLADFDRYLAYRARERERRRAIHLARAERANVDLEQAARSIDAELEAEARDDARARKRAEIEIDRRLEERYKSLERFHLLLTASVEVLGPVEQGVGVEAFLERTVQRSGHTASISPRIGLETEAIPAWLKLRAGAYLEPSRFDQNPRGSRLHATFGLDQRLFGWEVFGLWPRGATWRATGSVDVAEAYFAWGLSIGMWH
ncbi:MAG: hypothetical protein DIU78_016125 [Pseudomonadota bacterium]|nr:MAG: hypothetical protein DIU78_07415 [Pseudomonadota bacterium]